MVTQPPVESYFTCSLHFSKPNGRKQMILLFNLLVINSNDSTLFCGPADKIDTFSHLFLPNSRKTSKSSTYVLHYLFSHLHKKPRLTCSPGLLGNNGIWRFLWLLKKAAVEAKQYLSRKLASIEHMLPLLKKNQPIQITYKVPSCFFKAIRMWLRKSTLGVRMEASSGFMKKLSSEYD